MAEYIHEPGEGVATKTRRKTKPKEEVKRPPMYKVLLHNDDYTTMEFVVQILKSVFKKSTPEAVRIMLNVHRKGIGVCGAYTAKIAETKVNEVHKRARESGFPLRCSMEPE